MRRVGGNTTATIQRRAVVTNEIGEHVESWQDVMTLRGWLDYSGGQESRQYDAKLADSTHVFACDYVELPDGLNADTARLVCDGRAYEITGIDDPMNLHYQLEIGLRYTGGETHG